MAEIMFEEFNVPAFYIANTGVLNAYADSCFLNRVLLHSHSLSHRFAAGKGSALVIDIGQAMTSVTPVVDGFVLRKGCFQYTQKLTFFE
jgi:actin-like protein 6B